ncbi:MAG: hypothetical protein GIX03_16360 [Candidatus Eremiobacteraeota bacterium]|nr:hypothetical protein [Candidatus Eremiobacteraeota bacterium]MBC5804533.1 hypothetical protein [Candidatus Eremiobacteraeota bacterium]MBC5820975.1 hypothetical protein [Candidatus Eremiobacteraeota bacterium]
MHRGRDIDNLIEEQRSARSGFEAADALGDGAREGALLETEEFRFQERLGYRGAIDGHERAARAGGVGVNGAGD